MKLLYFLLFLVCSATQLQAADTVRVCTWNLLNYSMNNEDGRTPAYRKVLTEIQPDIIVVQEMVESAAVNYFADSALPATVLWELAGFFDGPDTDNMLYCDANKFFILSTSRHTTSLRHIIEYVLQVKSTGDTLRVFSLHLKANDDEAIARDAEAQVLENRLNEIYSWDSQAKILVVGDFNFYSTNEPAYKRLVNAASAPLVDPLSGWSRNDADYALFYTQSTRIAADANCGGGTTGGMDDRFDMILHSKGLTFGFTDTYGAYGNDGQSRLNSSIDDPPNTFFSAEIAAALRCASDHLPVVADFAFGTTTFVPEEFTSAGFRIYPMPVTEESVIELFSPTDRISIMDVLGREVYSVAVDGRSRVQLPRLAPGVYGCRIGGAGTLLLVQ